MSQTIDDSPYGGTMNCAASVDSAPYEMQHVGTSIDGLYDEFRDIETQTLPLSDWADMRPYWT